MQALLFAALLANARAHVDGDRFFAPVAGGAARPAAVPALRRGARHRRRRRRRWRSACFAGQRAACAVPSSIFARGGAALASLYLLGPMRAYADLPIVFLSNLPAWEYVLVARRC